MASQARRAFDQSAKDIDLLLEVHQHLGANEQSKRSRREVLNKAAIVLITAIWEAYCEDIAAEALNHMITKAKSATDLPKDLKKKIASQLKNNENEIAIWELADAGWKRVCSLRLDALTQDRNRRLNTPKSGQIDELFAMAIGLKKVSSSWKWRGMTVEQARQKLDEYVALRGEIAHRGGAAKNVQKSQVEDYFNHVKQLVAKTGGCVNSFVKGVTTSGLW
jgi:RiboL-PSP-HEPN